MGNITKQGRDIFNKHRSKIMKVIRGIRYALSAVTMIAFFLFFFYSSLTSMFICILAFWAINLCFALSKFSCRLAYTLFLSSFFCFLMGRMAMDLLTNGTIRFYFSDKISGHMLLTIMLSLIFLQIGFELFEKWRVLNPRHKDKKSQNNPEKAAVTQRMRQYAKWLFYLSAVFAILMNMEQIYFIYQNSYLDLYKYFSSSIPRVLQVLGNSHLALLFLYLATRPSKKKCILPLSVFFVISLTGLLAGDRGLFIVNIAVMLVYVFWRQYQDREIWIGKKIIIIGVCCIPVMIAGMSFFVYLREGVDVGEKTFSAQFIRFFNSTGNTVDLLGYGNQFQHDFPQHFYSFGELIDYVKYNPISQLLFGIEKPLVHTAEYATTMHSYAHMISYLIAPDKYLLGHGYGSAYIAEAYHDFGYLGVIICNGFYGCMLAGIYKLRKAGPVLTAAAFIGLRIMFYVPRGPMISPITYVLNITTVFVLAGIWLCAKYQPKASAWYRRIFTKGK